MKLFILLDHLNISALLLIIIIMQQRIGKKLERKTLTNDVDKIKKELEESEKERQHNKNVD